MSTPAASSYTLSHLREFFPALSRREGSFDVTYLDSASTTHKPRVVLEAERHFYSSSYANVHRGVYGLAQEADAQYEAARQTAQRFLNAAYDDEIVFTGGTTAALNLVAQSWGAANLKGGDEILLTLMEHHANIVPWRMIADRTGALIKVIPILSNGALDLEAASKLLSPRTRVLAFTHVSNVLGTANPVAELCAMARKVGAISVVDGAQAVSHRAVDVRGLGCDFYVFGGHKVFGPTGIGVLYGRRDLLRKLPPLLGGGGMIDTVQFDKVTYAPPPQRFEAGTPPIAQAIGLAAALDWIQALGLSHIEQYVEGLGDTLQGTLQALPGVRVYGSAPGKSAVCAFAVDGVHPHDVATILGSVGVCVRAGHHCCMPLMEHFGVPALSRASLAVYNTEHDIETLAAGIRKVQKMLA